MFAGPLPAAATVMVFMDGHRTGMPCTKVFRNRPTSFEKAVAVASNADHNLKSTRVRRPQALRAVRNPWTSAMLKMKKPSLVAAEARRGIHRCFTYGSSDRLWPACPLRKQRQTQSSGNTASNGQSGSSRGNGNSQ
ncbi:hypothetical protein PF005_g4949 [Phytophthora fragariae]|uniref:Uncharacterized protein n=1 Tax=Phytophthora fragariae TaxID=53985 RepID=A0A6A4E5E1_9STRA|nr:hypothetical protein PF003_g30318 [Phytophthora fragariae]KAE8939097.1 hypothetical protein PF009_g11053 [Phytophthora fragariae]KAE9022067.1 hypothetical protein PF011_g4646 [Phytophthora fragariae]KAE9109055.1 hypothetical protein PF010_g11682 [Phytophthora fragariae]KAE9115262.1 hypothetical protein PF007_g10093 [Phytophthora fragariae]